MKRVYCQILDKMQHMLAIVFVLVATIKNNMNIIFESFLQCGENVREIRHVLGDTGKHIKIASQIENYLERKKDQLPFS